MVMARQLDYLVETDMVELANFLLVDPIDYRDKLAIAASPAMFLAFPSPITVLSLVQGFSLSLTPVFIEDCPDGLLTGGMACREVKQLSCHP